MPPSTHGDKASGHNSRAPCRPCSPDRRTSTPLKALSPTVLLVENADSFEQVCKVAGVAKNWLCIWGKGYTSHGMIALLTHFSSLPITAWFDLDADGIKIIDVLEQKLQRQVQPVGMDLELWPSTPHRIQSRKQVDRDAKHPPRTRA